MIVMLALVAGCTRGQGELETLPVQLVPAEHAYGLPAGSIAMAPTSHGSRWERWADKNCRGPQGDENAAPPSHLLEPIAVTVRADSIQWMSEPALEVPEASDEADMLIRPLYELALETTARRRLLYESCRGDTTGLHSTLVLVIADRKTPNRTLQRVLYSLGQAMFSSFAMLVEDPAPEGSRENTPLGGLVEDGRDPLREDVTLYTGTLMADEEAMVWLPDDGAPVPLSRSEPWPRSMGLPAPPTVALVSPAAAPVETWLTAQDRLAGAQVYCALPSGPMSQAVEGAEDPPATPRAVQPLAPPRQPLRIRTSEVLPVHLLVLPGFGALVIRRPDGARCSQLVRVRAQDPPPDRASLPAELQSFLEPSSPQPDSGERASQ